MKTVAALLLVVSSSLALGTPAPSFPPGSTDAARSAAGMRIPAHGKVVAVPEPAGSTDAARQAAGERNAAGEIFGTAEPQGSTDAFRQRAGRSGHGV